MQLLIITLAGQQYSIEIDTSQNVLKLKEELAKIIDIIPERQKIIYCGHMLENDGILDSYDLQTQTQLHLVIIDEKKYWEKIIQEKLNIKQTHNKRTQGLLFAKENRVVTLSRLLRNRRSLMAAGQEHLRLINLLSEDAAANEIAKVKADAAKELAKVKEKSLRAFIITKGKAVFGGVRDWW